jgi:hypothetical protein
MGPPIIVAPNTGAITVTAPDWLMADPAELVVIEPLVVNVLFLTERETAPPVPVVDDVSKFPLTSKESPAAIPINPDDAPEVEAALRLPETAMDDGENRLIEPDVIPDPEAEVVRLPAVSEPEPEEPDRIVMAPALPETRAAVLMS